MAWKTEWWKLVPRTEYRKENEKEEEEEEEDTLRDFWDIKHTNIHIIRGPKGAEREKGPEKTFEEIIAENFPNMGKETVNQFQESPSPR